MKTLLFTLTFATCMWAQPSINNNGIVNANGYQTKLAPDTLFVIYGSGLGPSTMAFASASNYPLALSGTSIVFAPAAGGAAIPARILYTSDTQVAGLLPSSIAPDTYAVQVTYNNQTSAPQNVPVVARSFGIATANEAGTGTAQATIGNVNGGLSLTRLTSGSLPAGNFNFALTPAHPGDVLVFWGTGGGADAANDLGGTSGDQTAAGNFVVNIAGRQITPFYAGASPGSPGLWQINFALPADIPPDCFSFAQVTAGGELSNAVSIPIAPAGQSACSSPGFSQEVLNKLDAGNSILFASFRLGRITGNSGSATEMIAGQVARYSAAEWTTPFASLKFDLCSVLDLSYSAGGKDPTAPDAFLDAGAELTLHGPNLPPDDDLRKAVSPLGPVYNLLLPAGTLFGGTYTLVASGGTVDPFVVSATLPTGFEVTNLDSISVLDRTQPLAVNWDGDGFDQVILRVQASSLNGNLIRKVTVSCSIPADLGSYSIPAEALAYLPAVSDALFSATTALASEGVVTAVSSTAQTLTPKLLGGGQVDFGSLAPFLAVVKSITIQ